MGGNIDGGDKYVATKQTINKDGLELVQHFEGCDLNAYLDAVGVPTIGWGRTVRDDGTKVQMGDTCTEAEADKWLLEDLESEGSHYVRAWVRVPLNDNQFSALTSFVYNLGAGHFRNGLLDYVNRGDMATTADKFLDYDVAQGIQLAGLLRRRKAERNLFMSLDWKEFKS